MDRKNDALEETVTTSRPESALSMLRLEDLQVTVDIRRKLNIQRSQKWNAPNR